MATKRGWGGGGGGSVVTVAATASLLPKVFSILLLLREFSVLGAGEEPHGFVEL